MSYFPDGKDLPKTMHGLLRLAVYSGEQVECDKNYSLNMNYWYSTDSDGEPCRVCMAGAVLAKGLSLPKNWEPSTYAEIPAWMVAIDDMRTGMVETALYRLVGIKEFGILYSMYDKRIQEISLLIQSMYDKISGRAPWDVYLEAADLLESLHYLHVGHQVLGDAPRSNPVTSGWCKFKEDLG